MNRAPARFGWAALFIAWMADQVFWEKAPGISFPLWVALALATGLWVARSLKIRPPSLSWALIALALVFASITFLRREGFTIFINTMLCLASLALLTATFRTGNWLFYKIGDHINAGLRLWAALIVRPADLFPRVGKPQTSGPSAIPGPTAESRTPGALPSQETAEVPPARPLPAWKTARNHVAAVVRGLLLALPIVLVLGGLLAAADPIFNNWAREALKAFDLSKLPEYLLRLVYIGFLAYALAGTYLHAVQPSVLEPRPDLAKQWLPSFVGWTESVVVLGAVNLLFLVFVGIQFWYLFGGQANISTSGFTYSEYARRGFNELVMVAVLSLLLYLGVGAVAWEKTALQQKVRMGLNALLILQVLVILVSSFSRLRLYEEAYGFTQLRTYTHILIIWLALLLIATIGLELTRSRHWFARAALLVACGFGLTFGLFNVDSFIAQQNIQRAWTSGKFDGQYLSALSEDVVPTLLEEFQRPNQPDLVKDLLGAELSCRTALANQGRAASSNTTASPFSGWLSFNLSQAISDNLLQANQSLWQAYPISQENRAGMAVKLKSGLHYCRSSDWID